MTEPALSRLRSALAELVRLDAVPDLPLCPLRRARIVGQSGDKVSLQMVRRDGEMPDAGQEARQPVWYGVPGVSAVHTIGQEILLGFASADASDPVVFLAPPRGQPGHVPILVRFEATTELRFLEGSAGVGRFGPGATQKVALGPALDLALAALSAFATAVSSATTVPQIAAAAGTLSTALGAIAVTKANKLEAI